MNSTTRTDYLVCNRLGVVLFTSDDRAIAIRAAKEREAIHSGVHVEELTVTTTRRKVWSPRVQLVAAQPHQGAFQ